MTGDAIFPAPLDNRALIVISAIFIVAAKVIRQHKPHQQKVAVLFLGKPTPTHGKKCGG